MNDIINVTSLDALAEYGINNVVIAIGVFDGLHLGHIRLLDKLMDMGEKEQAEPVVFTFFPHPRKVLRPDSPPAMLIPQEKKSALLREYGISAIVTFPFTAGFARLSPKEFIKDCLHSPSVKLKGICVGNEWRFGAEGKGNVDVLHEYADHGYFKFCGVDELKMGKCVVSSTAVRRAVASGRLDVAAQMLGRDYSIIGKVERGFRIASEELAYPTANLRISDSILPPNGVYAGIGHINGDKYPAAVAIGVSPTFKHDYSGHQLRVEVHLIGFEEEIYGETLEVEIVDYIREELCFSSPDELKKQIVIDVEKIGKILEKKHK